MMLAITIIISAFGIIQLQNKDGMYTQILEGADERLSSVEQIRYQFMNVRRVTTLTALRSGDSSAINTYEAEVSAGIETIRSYMDDYRQSIASDRSVDAAMAAHSFARMDYLESVLEDYYRDIAYPVIAAARADDIERATALILDGAGYIAYVYTEIHDINEQSELLVQSLISATQYATTTTTWIFLVIVVVAVVAGIWLATYVSGLITKPMTPIATFFSVAAKTGDVEFTPEEAAAFHKYKTSKDELGIISTAIIDFMDEIVYEMKMLKKVGEGDLTMTPNVLSEKDLIGSSLTTVIDKMNEAFANIQMASAQVSAGASQIADGATQLAQSSTEQSATVEELSAAVTEISEQTKSNSEMADKAHNISDTIKANAEKGNRQMDEMVDAVNEISDSSRDISKVIKVIDDLAFQTNILALNAAVEAARAGVHGKGFAVVADEVRNLAAKSAEAAKSTNALISNSVEKSEYGVRIARETAEGLAEIVAGINESADVIAMIARSSGEQANAVAQINVGIDQVAGIVQQNSATAEQSAASAEELSSQSVMMENLIAQFKLKNAGNKLSDTPIMLKYAGVQRTGFALGEG